MFNTTKVLEIRFLALFLISFFIVFNVANAQNAGLNRGAVYEKSSARDADLVKIPALQHQVTDLTNTLSADQISNLENKLSQFEQRKGSQIAILIVPTTQPEAIEQYTLRVVEKWKVGRKKIDDGLLLLVAKDDRRLRIEVGYGLEGAVNDVTARRIIAEKITPLFKLGQFYEGIESGVDQLIKVIDGEELPPPPKRPQANTQQNDSDLEGILLIAFMISIFLGNILKKILGKTLGGLTTGGVVGFLAFTITGVIGIAIIAGLIGFVASLLGGLGGRGGPIIFPSGGYGGRVGGFGGGFGGGGGGGFGGGGSSGGW